MSTERTKPVVIIEPGAMSKRDVAKMNKAGITVVEAKNPEAIRFLDPPPFDRNAQERAAIELCRVLLQSGSIGTSYQRYNIAEMYVKLLLEGSPICERHVPSVAQVPTQKKAA